jgi:hypothetical protein
MSEISPDAGRSFEEVLADHLALEQDETSVEAIYHLLGSREVSYNTLSFGNWSPDLPPQPDLVHEPLVQQTLLTLLRRNGSFGWQTDFMLLDGFIRHHRWKTCISNTDDALMFTGLLVKTSRLLNWLQTQKIGPSFRQYVFPELCSILTAWYMPETQIAEFPTPEDVAAHLFGDAWCMLALTDIEPVEIPKVINSQRPPFRYGSVPADFDAPDNFELPSMTL